MVLDLYLRHHWPVQLTPTFMETFAATILVSHSVRLMIKINFNLPGLKILDIYKNKVSIVARCPQAKVDSTVLILNNM